MLPEDQPVVHVLRRLRAQSLGQLAMQRLVGAVVVAADDVRDPELDVVHDARQVVGRRPVLSKERDATEALAAEPLRRGAVRILPLALTNRALVPTPGRATPDRG